MAKSPIDVVLMRLRRSRKSPHQAYPIASYRTFLANLGAAFALRARFRTHDLTLTNDLMRLSTDISRCIKQKGLGKQRLLLFELLDRDADVSTYDDLCSAIHSVVSGDRNSRPWCIVFAVSNVAAFKESVLLSQRLRPFCASKSTGLVLLGCGDKIEIQVVAQGGLPQTSQVSSLQPPPSQKTSITPDAVRSLEQIEVDFQTLFGHFEAEYEGIKYHIPAIGSARKLAKDRVFVQQLHQKIIQTLGEGHYQVMPVGIAQGGIDDLCFSLVDGDVGRLLLEPHANVERDSRVAIVCDFVMPAYPFERICSDLLSKGVKQVMIAGIGRYADAPQIRDVPVTAFLHTHYTTAKPLNGCAFCNQDVPVMIGSGYDALAHQVAAFDPFTFWELVKQDPNHYRAGHWKSDRTPNHYQFRIMVGPILRKHCHGLSLRIRNVLESRSILPTWIDKIICIEREESQTLALGLADVVGLGSNDVVAIPRRLFSSIIGSEVGAEVWRYIADTYGKSALRQQNVILVDQAAHHFKTLSALRAICERTKSKILAFAVVLDRTDAAFTLGEFLHDSHYISLYSWASPPRLPHECPCAEVAA